MALKHLFGCRGGGDAWARHGAKGGFSRLFNPVYLFDNKTSGNMVMVAIDMCGKSPITG